MRHIYSDSEEGAKDFYENRHGQKIYATEGHWVFADKNDEEIFSWESFSSCPTDIVEQGRSVQCADVFTPWSMWSSCDPDCYDGVRSRERSCAVSEACEDDDQIQHEACSPAKCAEMATAQATTTSTSTTTTTSNEDDKTEDDLIPSDSAGSNPFGPPQESFIY